MTANLIRHYHETGDLTSLITLFEALKAQRDRSEYLTQGYLHQIKLLSQKFAEITEPATGQKIAKPTTRPITPSSHPKPLPVEPLEI